jgi:UDP-glucose 4-epimerase
MKVMVTGGAGFLGSHVADALSEAGHQVVVLDIEPSRYLRHDQIGVVANILDDATLLSAMQGCDVVYHFAAVADIGESISSPPRAVEVNVMGTVKTLEAARKTGCRRFVLASTIYVYSNGGFFYRTSKLACERLVEDYQRCFDLPFTILRFGSLYGPRADATNAIYRMISQALHEGRIEYPGTGEEIREYIHVLDGAGAAVQILDREFENEIVHLTGHERMTSRAMIDMITEICGKPLDIRLSPGTALGHYNQTPYSYNPRLGRKLIRRTFIDLGLGLLDLFQEVDLGRAKGKDERQ